MIKLVTAPASVTKALTLLCVAIALATTASVCRVAPALGGLDFFFFIQHAQDIVVDAANASVTRHAFFPGTYNFWATAYRAFGHDLYAFQIVFVVVLLANAALVAGMVYLPTRSAAYGLLAYAGYLRLTFVAGVTEMTTEPICTLIALTGLLLAIIWLRKQQNSRAMIAYGVGLGLSLYVKQQAALLSLGAIGLLPALVGWTRERILVRHAALLVGSALAASLIPIALEDDPMLVLKEGLGYAVAYPVRGSFLRNLEGVFFRLLPLSAFFVLSVAALGFFVRRAARSSEPTLALLTWAVAAVSGFASLFQFVKRPFFHYALLGLPFMVASVAVMIHSIHSLAVARWPEGRLRRGFIVVAGALVCAWCATSVGEAVRVFGEPVLSRSTIMAQRYEGICERVPKGGRLLLLPSKYNELHWHCQTHARGYANGYNYILQERPETYIDALKEPATNHVFVFEAFENYHRRVYAQHDWSGFFSELTAQGFVPVARNRLGILYNRRE